MGARGVAGQIAFDLALLYDHMAKKDLAMEYAGRSVAIFRDCHAEGYLEKARRFIAERG